MVNKNLSSTFNIYIKNAMIGDLTAKTPGREETQRKIAEDKSLRRGWFNTLGTSVHPILCGEIFD